MANPKNDFQEFHHGEKEYCRESGPLNSKSTKFPPFSFLNGLELIGAALAATVLAVAIAAIYLLSAPRAIYTESAVINVNIYNRPADAVVTYIVTPANDPDTVVVQGRLDSDKQTLHLYGLESDTKYVITYFAEEEDGVVKKLNDLIFTTDKEAEEATAPIEPEETTPPTEPKETTAPTEPEDTTAPTEPEETTSPTEPEEKPTEPEEEVSKPKAQTPTLDSAAAETAVGAVTGYRCTQTHTFTGVPSDDCTFKVTQDGSALTDYSASYDSGTKTMTITVIGDAIAPGSSATTKVIITCEDGGTATSTKTVTTPNLNAPTLTATDNKNGTASFALSGDTVQPSEGSLSISVQLLPGNDTGESYEEDLGTDSAYSYDLTANVDAPGETLTAQAVISGYWSLDSGDTPLTVTVQSEYTMTPAGQITFDLEDAYYYDDYYGRDMLGQKAIATFTNLDLTGVDASSVNVTFTSHHKSINGDYVDDSYVWEYRDEGYLAMDDGSYTVTVDPENGTVTASIIAKEYALHSSYMFEWTATLTFVDVAGETQTRTLEQPLSYGYVKSIGLNAISYINSAGENQVDVELTVSATESTPGYLKLDAIFVSQYDQYVDTNMTEKQTDSGYVWTISFVDSFVDLSVQPHFYWTADPFQNRENRAAEAHFSSWDHTVNILSAEGDVYTAEETVVFYDVDTDMYTYTYEVLGDSQNVSVEYNTTDGTCTITFTRTGITPGTVSKVNLTNQFDDHISTSQSSYTYP